MKIKIPIVAQINFTYHGNGSMNMCCPYLKLIEISKNKVKVVSQTKGPILEQYLLLKYS